MKINQVISASFITISGLWTSFARADESPNPKEIYIRSMTHAGTGCPLGSASSLITDDGKAFQLIMEDFVVEAGPGLPLSGSRKACNVTLDLHIPQGWQYSVFKVDYKGFANLDRGVTAKLSSDYSFLGQRRPVSLSTTIAGPVAKDIEVRDTLGVESLVYSPCGISRPLNIKASAMVNARGSNQGLLTVDSVEGEFKTIYKIQWKKCR